MEQEFKVYPEKKYFRSYEVVFNKKKMKQEKLIKLLNENKIFRKWFFIVEDRKSDIENIQLYYVCIELRNAVSEKWVEKSFKLKDIGIFPLDGFDHKEVRKCYLNNSYDHVIHTNF